MKRNKLNRAKSLNKATSSASPHLFDELKDCKLWHNEQCTNTRFCPAASIVYHGRILGEKGHAETRMQSISNILEYKTDALQDFLDYALDEVIILTKSKIGFICFYDEKKHEFMLNTWSKDVYKDCNSMEKPLMYQLEKTGILGETVRHRRPVIDNDFLKANPLKKGEPEGHVQLYKFLAVPIFYEEKIVAVVALANKATDYDQHDLLDISLVMNSIWKTVESRRMHKLINDVESVLDALPLAAVLIDASDGRFSHINRRATQLFELNYTDFADQLTKINLQNLDGKSFSLEDLPVSQALGNGKTVHSQEMIIKRDGGTCAHVLVNSAPPV